MMPDTMLLLPELSIVKVRPLAKLMPNALLTLAPRSKMSPLLVLLVPMALFKVISPPYMLMGPFTLLLDAQVMLAVLVVDRVVLVAHWLWVLDEACILDRLLYNRLLRLF